MPWNFDDLQDRMDDDNREARLDEYESNYEPDYDDPAYDDDIYGEDDDDGQPSEYDEWQDLHGGDDWDHGQYDTDVEY